MEPPLPAAVVLEGDNNPPGVYTQAQVKKPKPPQAPQDAVDQFWANFKSKTPGKVFAVLPDNYYAKEAAAARPIGVVSGKAATVSFEQAANACRAKVEKISKECRRVNQKYRDTHFDIEHDLRISARSLGGDRFCLDGLDGGPKPLNDPDFLDPKSVKRIEVLFSARIFVLRLLIVVVRISSKHPSFSLMAQQQVMSDRVDHSSAQPLSTGKGTVPGPKATLEAPEYSRCSTDGEWISTIIDDKLYLTKPDYDDPSITREQWEDRERLDGEEEYRKTYQTGSGALYFAQCRDPNETWLPLLEKAYAKAHGDYSAISGGWVGEGIEDLTGGVTSELYTTDILDKEKFWTEELMKVNEEFLFGCATGLLSGGYGWRRGIVEGHAYSIMKAREIDGERLLLLRLVRKPFLVPASLTSYSRNPWGSVEWSGPWSDGSKEWTPEWMAKLQHRFGDDGAFWIHYRDLLRKYQHFDRTRLFGPEWTVTQQWTTLPVPWTVAYHDTKFEITLTKDSPVVIMLAQLDDRYFRGLEGRYAFELQFRVHRKGERDYLVRSHGSYCMRRSVSTELDLEAGKYLVLIKVIATRYDGWPSVEQVVRDTSRRKRDKLLQIGLSYDLAHAKAQVEETDEQKKQREEKEKKEKEAERKKRKEEMKALRDKMREKERKRKRKEKERAKRAQKKRELREAAQKTQKLNTEAEESGRATKDATDAAKDGGDLAKIGGDLGSNVAPHDEKALEPKEERITNGPKSDVDAPHARETLTVPEMPNNAISPSQSPAFPYSPYSDLSSGLDDDSFDDDSDFSTILSHPSNPQPVPDVVPDASQDVEPEETDPWNAVCVVGLRVYTKDTDVSVQVITPKEPDKASLDVDDLAADATKEDADTGPKEGRKEGNEAKKVVDGSTKAGEALEAGESTKADGVSTIDETTEPEGEGSKPGDETPKTDNPDPTTVGEIPVVDSSSKTSEPGK
ncbi:hypothetical protein FGG08_005003 [Glutinoglossum americanum]|uniref:Calpain catalytic domain-containing protein n=1 Tax=Glutinoglossum americanum TaxID=1670608 RepID=A0A9P8I6C0_9PEZI|nr:hypothetical protein FGG08_005003 [Glutinoglossum americanum]